MHDPGLEFVDIIDEEGKVINTVTRREMRRQRLPHRCVYILVFNSQGELFTHLRTASKDVYPSHWDVAIGGVLAAGESFARGARRELCEELGLDLEPTELFPFHYIGPCAHVRAMVYKVVHNGPFQLQPEEIVRGVFLSLQQISQQKDKECYCPDGLAVLEQYHRWSKGLKDG